MQDKIDIILKNFKFIHERKKIEPKQYDFELVWNLILQLGQKLMPVDVEFTLVDERNEFYRQMIYYFFNDPKFKGDLARGLFIHGRKGTGKSMAVKIFNHFSFNNMLQITKCFSSYVCDNIVTEFEQTGMKKITEYNTGNKHFDELGDEVRNAVFFGTTRNIMKYILSVRNNLFVNTGKITIITSNYAQEHIGKLYDVRIEDRWNEMFNDIVLDGESLRKKYKK